MGIEFRQAIPIPVVPEVKDAPKTFDYEAELCFTGDDAWAGMQVGVGCGGKGYALMASMKDQCVHFMEVNKDAVLIDRGMRRLPLKKDAWYPIRATYDGKILRLWLNENPLDTDPWPKFEFELELPGPGVALDCREGATFRNESLSELAVQPQEGETFTNLMAQVDTYAKEMMIKFIMGAESLENYDQYIENVNRYGLARATEITQAALDRYYGISR